ncbi:MAG TPA: 3-isopropylmalate dehydratase small subunit [Stenotrophomonas sp.]|nr:3-isopropylmalate dehydratase small subunit [Stenotrophomonas sp.]
MAGFRTLTSSSVVLAQTNIDTDQIIPKQFLKTVEREGLAKGLFYDFRFDGEGNEIKDFVLNKPEYKASSVLVAGDNFGCGSSREHAPWALAQYGFRAIIAPSFADIFFNNCFKSGLLPIVLTEAQIDHLFNEVKAFPGYKLVVDLEQQRISTSNGSVSYPFEIDAFRKYCLMNGLDDIGLTLRHADTIREYEARHLATQPWLANVI